ncbi:PREDICTED: receptor expression-enhancing protein 6 isoform X1 [Myotis davidii]|uniref:receptor expression-enhancing protein 6 isoform X1 n=1 Tax=Myotis davidii TaxID=225400 RepID=UPI000766F713|nr:PREDICTED: receptor expression-enhancing protein 6 isoform X1 [Myotis davidii]
MRRGRRGRPHLLCPPCPPIGRCVGREAGTKQEAKTSPGAERCDSLLKKAARARRDRCVALRSSSGCQPRSRRCHGRPTPALRASSGTEELGHRGTKGTRSQDRCRQAVLGSGSHHSAKPVSSVRLRGTSTLQSHRVCVPRICFDKSYRESKQRRRHCVAHLLGGVQPIRACRVLQRSTPVLVPFLLRGKVRLPVVLHDSRAMEWGSHAVPSNHTPAVSKASRGRGQHHERPQRASTGRGSRSNPGRQSNRDSAPEGQVKSLPSPRADKLAGQLKDTMSSTDSSTDSSGQTHSVPSAPIKPASGNASCTTFGPSHSQSVVTGSASVAKLPGKSQVQSSSKASSARANSSNQPQASVTSLGPSQPAQQSPGPGSGSVHHPSTFSSQPPPTVPSPSGTTIPMQPHSSPNRPGESALKGSKSNKHQKTSPTLISPSGTGVPMQPHSSPNKPTESAPKASKSNKHQKTSPTLISPSGTGVPMQPHSSPNRPGESALKGSKSNKHQKTPTAQPSPSSTTIPTQPHDSPNRPAESAPKASKSSKHQKTSPAQPSPSGTTIPTQPHDSSNRPTESALKASKSSKHQKTSPAQPPTSTSVHEQQPQTSTSEPELPVSYLSGFPLEYTSESTTEITCHWPHHHSWLQYLQHCWRLKHLSC